jgi:hypothetical protein
MPHQPRTQWCCQDQMLMAREIISVADQMFPEPTLPNPFFALPQRWTECHDRRGQMSGKGGFDEPPSVRKIVIARRQGPDHLNLRGQDHCRINAKRHPLLTQPRGITQKRNLRYQQIRLWVAQVDAKVIGATRNIISDVICHKPINGTAKLTNHET